MSARVAALEELFAAWSAGDFRPGAELFDEHFSFVTFNPDSDEVRAEGHSGIAAWLREFFTTWEDFTVVPERFEERGDVVLAEVRQSGRGRTSGVLVEMPIYTAFRFEGDRVTELHWLRSRRQAEAVAGPADHP